MFVLGEISFSVSYQYIKSFLLVYLDTNASKASVSLSHIHLNLFDKMFHFQ